MSDLTGRVALITGAGRGFGLAISQRFAEAGADLILHYRASREGCERVARQVVDLGNRAHLVQADMSDSASIERMADEALGALGRVDILINNAGVMYLSPFAGSDQSEWRHEVEVNIFGPLVLTRQVLPHMIEQRYGKIVNVASQLAHTGFENGSVYAGTKGFLHVWTKSLAREVGQYNINVNAVGPGSIVTDMNRVIFPTEEAQRERAAQLPLRRLGSPGDVAECALFLSSEAGSFLTGQMLGPNGGNVM